MTANEIPKKSKSKIPVPQNELGLFDYVGSFPVWLLKIIDMVTPEFLKSKTPPK
jgi:hypothetical protein